MCSDAILSRFLSVIMIPDVETPQGGNEGLLACDMCFKVFGSVSQSGDKMFHFYGRESVNGIGRLGQRMFAWVERIYPLLIRAELGGGFGSRSCLNCPQNKFVRGDYS